MQQRDHRMSADQIRAYATVAASLKEWGAEWSSLVRDCIKAGIPAELIAEKTGTSMKDVLAALKMPTVLAEYGPEAVGRAIEDRKARGMLPLGTDDESDG